MNRTKLAVLLLFTLSTQLAHATQTLEEIPISESIQIQSQAGKSLTLPLLGAGIRKKHIAFLKFKIYVAAIFAQSESSWQSTSEPIAIRMNFLRNLPINKVIDSFSNSLKINEVNLETPEMKRIFDIVRKNGDIKDQQALTITGIRGEKEQLVFTLSSGESETIEGQKGLVRDFFKIWFGKLEDGGMENFMEQVLEKKKI